MLKVKNMFVSINTKFGKVPVIRDVSLYLKEGEVLAILGESGSGKTVLCKSIMGILPFNAKIEKGEILLDDKNLVNLSEKSMQNIRGKDISMIFQDPMTSLNPSLSVGKQIMEAVLKNKKVSKKEAKNITLDLMSKVGFENPNERFNGYPHEFSGGMIQRSVIACALSLNPKVLIADEPTTALDATLQLQILDLLLEIKKNTGISILFVTHDLGVVSKIADRVAVMYAGKIIETGTLKEIFSDSRHPYTWGLLDSLPSLHNDKLYSIPGNPPSIWQKYKGDAFAMRNPYALKIDYEKEPPMFKVSDTHYAATWLLHENAPLIQRGKI